MDWTTLKTRIAGYLNNRSNVSTTQIEEGINMSLHDLELDWNWRHMEGKASGNFTASSDSITIPTRYKMFKGLFITSNNQQKLLRKMDYITMIRLYPDGTTLKHTPTACSVLEADSKIYVRPYPDDTYPYELITFNYSADLSDQNTSNWFLTNAYELLLYGALLQLRALVNDDEQIAKWKGFYDERIAKLRKIHIEEEFAGSLQQGRPSAELI